MMGGAFAASILLSNQLNSNFVVHSDQTPLELSFTTSLPPSPLYRGITYNFDVLVNNTDDVNSFDYVIRAILTIPSTWSAGQVVMTMNGTNIDWDTTSGVMNETAVLTIEPVGMLLIHYTFYVDPSGEAGSYGVDFTAHGVIAEVQEQGEPPAEPEEQVVWLAGFDYRQNHTITGASGTPDDYSMKMTIYTGTGTASAGTMYCNNHAQSDFRDIRVAYANGTLIPHWFEKVYADHVDMWIKLDGLTDTQSILIYYGNSTVSSTSDASETFVFGEDWEDGNAAQWDSCTGSVQSLSSEPMNNYQGDYGAKYTANTNSQKNLILDSGRWMLHTMWATTNPSTGGWPIWGYDGENDLVEMVRVYQGRFVGQEGDYPNTGIGLPENTWYNLDLLLDLDAGTITLTYNGADMGTVNLRDTSNNAVNSLTIIGQKSSSTATCFGDCYTLRPYMSAGPQHAGWVAEESAI